MDKDGIAARVCAVMPRSDEFRVLFLCDGTPLARGHAPPDDLARFLRLTIYAAGTDLIAPGYPGVITVSNITQTSMTVSWAGATDNVGVTKYVAAAYSSCRRCITSSAKATTDGSARSVTLTGLLPGRQFVVSVSAVDAAGNAGPAGTLTDVRTLR